MNWRNLLMHMGQWEIIAEYEERWKNEETLLGC